MSPKSLALLAVVLLSGCGGGSDTQNDDPVSVPSRIQLIELAGQSNAGAGGVSPLLETRPLASNVLQFSGPGKFGYGSKPQPLSELTSFEPVRDVTGSHYVSTLLGLAIGHNSADTYLMRTDWYGGRPLDSFFEGSTNFANTIQAMTAAKSVAAAIGKGVESRWYVWIQGESGPADRTLYAEQLGSYVDSIRPAIARALEQSFEPTFAIVQTNAADRNGAATTETQGSDLVALAQWDLSRSKPGTLLAGPMYQAPMVVDSSDNIHSNGIGRMVLSDMLVDVFSKGVSWKPLQPRQVTSRGRIIDVKFDVPAGALAWDTQWIKPAPNYGFSYRDDGASADIADVAIVSPDTVRITLTATPTGSNPRIAYAHGVVDGELDGWASARGQLISPTQRDSYFHGLGYPVPAKVNHYSVRFSWPL